MRLTFEIICLRRYNSSIKGTEGGCHQMKEKNTFLRMVCSLAIPVALQFMLQASFGIIDQVMIGQLGSISVAGVGIAARFSSIFQFLVSAAGAIAGIMISQYMGQHDHAQMRRSFVVNLLFSLLMAGVFTLLCLLFPVQIMGLYSHEPDTVRAAADYLVITAGTYVPIAGATLLSVLFRCMEKAALPLYASIFAALVNTGLNYILIFGKYGVTAMGANGAALATLVSQAANFLVMLIILAILLRHKPHRGEKSETQLPTAKFNWHQYASMLLPVLICEFMWSLSENIYTAIYGRMGTKACAAMVLINPIQGLVMGALCGVSQAAGIIIGRELGGGQYEDAYRDAWRLCRYGLLVSALLSLLLIPARSLYLSCYRVEESVQHLTMQILIVYALIAPCKVQNMIIGGGILRSGGKTKYVMLIDLIGPWLIGVPLGLLSAFTLHLSIPYVYFFLSLEECVRLGISLVILRSRKWMQKL